MDGWETRRRRRPGPDTADHAIVRLGMPPGSSAGSSSTPRTSAGTSRRRRPSRRARPTGTRRRTSSTEWTTLVERQPLTGDSAHHVEVHDDHRWTHVRLTIYPDGGVARLRVHGEPVPDPRLLTETVDLAALENGGRMLGCSNEFYSSPNNLIKPGLPRTMGDGWETARRRDDGNDWVLAAGVHRTGPARRARHDALRRQRARLGDADRGRRHRAAAAHAAAARHPAPVPAARPRRGRGAGRRVPGRRGGAAATVRRGHRGRSPRARTALPQRAAGLARRRRSSARAAGAGHGSPRCATAVRSPISTRCSNAPTKRQCPWTTADSPRHWPGTRASASVLAVRGRARNSPASATTCARRCSPRTPSTRHQFGHVYLVCATGLSGEELLAICRERLANDAATERRVALSELAKINRIRLHKLLGLAP